jgi:hypothetical protein
MWSLARSHRSRPYRGSLAWFLARVPYGEPSKRLSAAIGYRVWRGQTTPHVDENKLPAHLLAVCHNQTNFCCGGESGRCQSPSRSTVDSAYALGIVWIAAAGVFKSLDRRGYVLLHRCCMTPMLWRYLATRPGSGLIQANLAGGQPLHPFSARPLQAVVFHRAARLQDFIGAHCIPNEAAHENAQRHRQFLVTV